MKKKTVIAAIAALLLLSVMLGVMSACALPDPHESFASGFGTDNNGYAKDDSEVERLISVVPSERQLNYMELEYYNFIHYGMNTYTKREWGTGDEDPALFAPTNLDTDQWCEVLAATGSKGIIITAKHHDGFCLWQTSTTTHSVASSPWKDGKGDVIADLSKSCEKYGLKMGIYLSPWDMNAECYGDTEAYNEFYMTQLTELLNGDYGPDFDGDGDGEIFCVWMDGARGEEVPADFEYHMDEWEDLIWRLQPDCVSANLGSEVRWVGNEAGIARESEWSVVSRGNAASQEYQESEEDADRLQSVSAEAQDMGSRELLKKYRDLVWYPSETDVSIRKGWFYGSNEYTSRVTMRKVDELLNIYFTSVGGNSSLLLNVPPGPEGIITDVYRETLEELTAAINATTANPVEITKAEVGDLELMQEKEDLNKLFDGDRDGYTFEDNEYILDLHLNKKIVPGRLDLREDLRASQRVEKFEVWCPSGSKWVKLAESTIIGNRRILIFENTYEGEVPETDLLRIIVKQSRSVPVLRSIELYAA